MTRLGEQHAGLGLFVAEGETPVVNGADESAAGAVQIEPRIQNYRVTVLGLSEPKQPGVHRLEYCPRSDIEEEAEEDEKSARTTHFVDKGL